jgi:serine/threonine-protein kinase
MAYEMLTGNLPFEADTPWEWATKHMTEVPRPFEQWPTGAAVPPKMRQALMRALAKKPEQRQSTVREFLDDFSVGGGRGRTSMPSHETPGAIMPPTSAMSSFDAPGAPRRTEIATPYMPAGGPGMGPGGPGMGPGGPGMGPGGHGMGPGPGAGYGPPPGAFAAPPPPPPGYGGGNESKGPNRGLIAALAGAAGLTVLVSIGLAVRHSMNRDSGSGERLDVPTTTAPATVATLPPNALPSGAAPTTTVPVVPGVPTIKPTGTAKPPGTAPTTTPPPTTPTTPPTAPPGVSGDAACVEARDRANKREISSAVAVFRACNGPSKSSAQSAIRGQTPNAVRDAVFRNECGKARRIAADGASAGARSIDVDREYPQCKGR